MTAHVEQEQAAEQEERVRIPRPVADGSYDVESLGPIVDRLMGDQRVRERAAETIRVLTVEDTTSEELPEAQVEVPPPVPGGSELVTYGDDPPAEQH